MRLSMATPASRAICCRSALRKVSGWKKSSSRTAPESRDPRRVRSTMSFTAAMRCTTPLQYDTGTSGPSQCFSHSGGTVSSMRHLPAAKIAGVSSSAPSNTLASADSVPSISATARCPRICSSSTNASTGGNVPEDGGGGADLSAGFDAVSRSHDRRSGESAADQTARSKPLEVPPAAAIVLSELITYLLLVTWTVRWTLTGRENSEGEFASSRRRSKAVNSR